MTLAVLFSLVFFGSELNDVIVHPEGSYTELEHLLMRLGLVTEMRPHASMQCDEDGLLQNTMDALGAGTGTRMEVDGGAEDKARRLGFLACLSVGLPRGRRWLYAVHRDMA